MNINKSKIFQSSERFQFEFLSCEDEKGFVELRVDQHWEDWISRILLRTSMAERAFDVVRIYFKPP
jgi:hypothetical protein